jgi:hypothetical protein
MDDRIAFMTPQHHAVRNFVVRELPRNRCRPLTPAQIAHSLQLDRSTVARLLDELEPRLFFLVRDARGNVSWAFPVTSDRTPHRLRFSTGERISGAWAEDAFVTPFVQGRLRNEALEVEISTACAHCARPMHITVDERLRWRVRERGADPRLFVPAVDWRTFLGRNIIGDYWSKSVFFWSEEHVPKAAANGQYVSLDNAAEPLASAQSRLFGFT